MPRLVAAVRTQGSQLPHVGPVIDRARHFCQGRLSDVLTLVVPDAGF